jgi:hypothetical protein
LKWEARASDEAMRPHEELHKVPTAELCSSGTNSSSKPTNLDPRNKNLRAGTKISKPERIWKAMQQIFDRRNKTLFEADKIWLRGTKSSSRRQEFIAHEQNSAASE